MHNALPEAESRREGERMAPELMNGRERRAYIRLETALPVKLKFSDKNGDKIYTATTRNISHGGLCLEVYKDIEDLIEKLSTGSLILGIDLNSFVTVQDAAVSSEPNWVNSRVDWTRKPSSKNPALLMGLEFEELAQTARKALHHYLVGEFVKHYEELN